MSEFDILLVSVVLLAVFFIGLFCGIGVGRSIERDSQRLRADIHTFGISSVRCSRRKPKRVRVESSKPTTNE